MKNRYINSGLLVASVWILSAGQGYADAVPPEFTSVAHSMEDASVCGLRAKANAGEIGDTGADVSCVDTNGIVCGAFTNSDPDWVTTVTAQETLMGPFGPVLIVEALVSHLIDISHNFLNPDTINFSGQSIVTHDDSATLECDFLQHFYKSEWSGNGFYTEKINFTLDSPASIQIASTHSTTNRIVPDYTSGPNDPGGRSTFIWILQNLTPPPGCSSPCIEESFMSTLGSSQTNTPTPLVRHFDAGNYELTINYLITPDNDLVCGSDMPPADETFISSGGVCDFDALSNNIDDWGVEFKILGNDCNGNGIPDESEYPYMTTVTLIDCTGLDYEMPLDEYNLMSAQCLESGPCRNFFQTIFSSPSGWATCPDPYPAYVYRPNSTTRTYTVCQWMDALDDRGCLPSPGDPGILRYDAGDPVDCICCFWLWP